MLCVGTVVHAPDRPAADRAQLQQQRYEADFRFNLVRVRENAEQIALLGGEPAERSGLLDRFGVVIDNWLAHHAAAEEAHVLHCRL